MVNRLVVCLLALTVGIQMLILYRQQKVPPQLPRRSAVESIAGRGLKVSVHDRPRLGDSQAKVAIIEFADFECPFCRKHASTVLPLLKKRFVDTGVAAYYYVHLPLGAIHPHATDAANAAACASSQGRFWEMHDLLFASEATALVPEGIRNVAGSLKLDLGAFDTCLSTVSERIASDVEQAKRLDINATPAFMLGTVESGDMIALSTRINGAQQLEVFEKAIADLRHETGSE